MTGHIHTMVLILDGNSEIGAQVKSNFCYLIFLRHLVGSRVATNSIVFSKKAFFLHACAACSELPSNVSTIIQRGEATTCLVLEKLLHWRASLTVEPN